MVIRHDTPSLPHYRVTNDINMLKTSSLYISMNLTSYNEYVQLDYHRPYNFDRNIAHLLLLHLGPTSTLITTKCLFVCF